MTEKRHVTEYHIGSDPDAVYRVYTLGKAAEALRAATGGSGDDGSATEMAGRGLIRRVQRWLIEWRSKGIRWSSAARVLAGGTARNVESCIGSGAAYRLGW